MTEGWQRHQKKIGKNHGDSRIEPGLQKNHDTAHIDACRAIDLKAVYSVLVAGIKVFQFPSIEKNIKLHRKHPTDTLLFSK